MLKKSTLDSSALGLRCFRYSYWAGITTPSPREPNASRNSFIRSTWFCLSIAGLPPRVSAPGHSQSMSTPAKFHLSRNLSNEATKASRLVLLLAITDQVWRVVPASENSHPPVCVSLVKPSGIEEPTNANPLLRAVLES